MRQRFTVVSLFHGQDRLEQNKDAIADVLWMLKCVQFDDQVGVVQGSEESWCSRLTLIVVVTLWHIGQGHNGWRVSGECVLFHEGCGGDDIRTCVGDERPVFCSAGAPYSLLLYHVVDVSCMCRVVNMRFQDGTPAGAFKPGQFARLCVLRWSTACVIMSVWAESRQ